MVGVLRFSLVIAACGFVAACGSASGDSLFSASGGQPGIVALVTGGAHQIGAGGTVNSGGRSTAGGGFVSSGGVTISGGGISSGATGPGGSVSAGGAVELGGDTGMGGRAAGGATSTGSTTGAGGAPMPTCTDRVKNQDETDVDCGGAKCSPCLPGQICRLARDCGTGVCANGLLGFGLCRIATCGDKTLNGQETDQDCGGPSCAPCASGRKCNVKSDCAYGACSSGYCTCTPLTCKQITGACGPNIPDGCGTLLTCDACSQLCNDTMKDGNETAADCGGPDCPKCKPGATCNGNGDCESAVCKAATTGAQQTCRAPTCMDTTKNGGESDVDCGGPTCLKCANGRACTGHADCASANCVNGLCACKPLTCADYPTQCGSLSNGCGATIQCSCAPLCMDTMQDGHETDVNCGGGDCSPCMAGQACTVAGDCDTGNCAADTSGGTALVCQ